VLGVVLFDCLHHSLFLLEFFWIGTCNNFSGLELVIGFQKFNFLSEHSIHQFKFLWHELEISNLFFIKQCDV
jgi:hypothetical protein